MSNSTTNDTVIQVMPYSEKSFVCFGKATKEHKDMLHELGGGYNRYLTHPQTKEKFSGWIFPIKKRATVIDAFIMKDIEYETID
jgi:hypothetical protein